MSRKVAQILCLAVGCLAFTFFAVHGQLQSPDEHLTQLRTMLQRAEQASTSLKQASLAQTAVETKAVPKAQPEQVVHVDAVPDGPHPVWELQVPRNVDLDDLTRDQYEEVAKILSERVTVVPDDRWGFYSAVNHPPEWVIERWIGVIRDVVVRDDGSYLVTASARPRLNMSQFFVLADYSEQYLISGGVVTYLGFLDPKGGFGQMPPMACY